MAIGEMSKISLRDLFTKKRAKKLKQDEKFILDENKKREFWLDDQPKYVRKEVKKMDKYLRKHFDKNSGLFQTIVNRLGLKLNPSTNLEYAVDQRMATILTYKEMIKEYDQKVRGITLDTKNWAFEALDLIGADVYDREKYKDIDAYTRKDYKEILHDYRQNKLPRMR